MIRYHKVIFERAATSALLFGACALVATSFGAWGAALALTVAAIVPRRRASLLVGEVGAVSGWVLAEPSVGRIALVLAGSVALWLLSWVRAGRGRRRGNELRTWGLGLGLAVVGLVEWGPHLDSLGVEWPRAVGASWLVLCAWFVLGALGLLTEGFTTRDPLRPSLRGLATARGGVGRNAVAAAVATAADFALFHSLLGAAPPGMATLAGCALGSVVNFGINRSWVFEGRSSLAGAAVRYAWVSGASAAVNAAAVSLALLEPTVTPALAWMVARTISFLAWNHPMQRDHVFV